MFHSYDLGLSADAEPRRGIPTRARRASYLRLAVIMGATVLLHLLAAGLLESKGSRRLLRR